MTPTVTPAVTTLLGALEASAKAAQAAEDELRKAMTEQVKRLERQRAFAFRRTRLVRVLASRAGTAQEKPGEEKPNAAKLEEIWQAQRSAVREELGWTAASEAHEAILVKLQPVAAAIRDHVCGEEGATPAEVMGELEAFEAWFESTHGTSFYALFDQYFQEVPVVDF